MSDKRVLETEKTFYNSLVITKNNKNIEYLVIGKLNYIIKWYFALRIAELIKDYFNNEYDKEVKILFSLNQKEVINNTKIMNSNDILILELNDLYGKYIVAYIESLKNEQKNFIYISDEDNPQNNELIPYFTYCWKDIKKAKKDNKKTNSIIRCKVCNEKIIKKLFFSYPKKDLIREFHEYKKDVMIRWINDQI